MSIRVCQWCAKEFTVAKKTSRAKYCSQECRSSSRKKQHDEDKAAEEEVHYDKGFKMGDIPPDGEIKVYTRRTERKGIPILVKFECTQCLINKYNITPGKYTYLPGGFKQYGTYYGNCHCGRKQTYNEQESPQMHFYIRVPPKGELSLQSEDIKGAKELYEHYAHRAFDMNK